LGVVLVIVPFPVPAPVTVSTSAQKAGGEVRYPLVSHVPPTVLPLPGGLGPLAAPHQFPVASCSATWVVDIATSTLPIMQLPVTLVLWNTFSSLYTASPSPDAVLLERMLPVTVAVYWL